jgi:glucosamine-phosphate N-acetyltransferase
MKKLEIRDLTLEDLYSEDQGFYKTLEQFTFIPLTLDQAKQIFYDRQHSGCRTLVVTLDGLVIATATIIIETKFIRGGNKVAHVEDVAVRKEFQRTGIGRMIVEELIKIAQEAKCYKITLDTKTENVVFYEKLGFRKHEYGMRLDLQE